MKHQGFIPLYQQLFEHYRERIIRQEYRPGARIDSIQRIMAKHAVSRETAKHVLSKLEQEKYIVKRAGKGSFVTYTREMRKIWGIVIPFLSANIEELIGYLHDEAKDRKRDVRYYLHYNDPAEEMRQVGSMIREGYEAILVVPNDDESLTAHFYRKLNSGRTSIILLDHTMVGSFFNYVIQSYDLGVKRAFQYLMRQNPDHFLFIKDENWRGANQVHELMEQSFRMFIQKQCPDRLLHVVSGLHALDQAFFRKWRIGGILCNRDVDAVRLVRRIQDWGMELPDDIALVCYGNTELTVSGRLPLTVVDCQYRAMAREAISLINCDECHRVTRQVILEPELVIRST